MTAGAAALLLSARTLPAAWVATPLGGPSRAARLVLAGVLALAAWPAVVAQAGPGSLGLAVAREALVGLLLGLVAAVPFEAARAAGLLVDDGRLGAALPSESARRPLGEAFGLLALALWASLGGPRLLVLALVRSYAAVPLGAAPASMTAAGDASAGGVALVLEAGAQLVGAALLLAAPALAAMLLAELVVALAARAQPLLGRALGLGAVRTVAALLVLTLGLGSLLRALAAETGALPGRLEAAARQLVPRP